MTWFVQQLLFCCPARQTYKSGLGPQHRGCFLSPREPRSFRCCCFVPRQKVYTRRYLTLTREEVLRCCFKTWEHVFFEGVKSYSLHCLFQRQTMHLLGVVFPGQPFICWILFFKGVVFGNTVWASDKQNVTKHNFEKHHQIGNAEWKLKRKQRLPWKTQVLVHLLHQRWK